MGETAKLTKKQKKALAFRERKGKGKAKATDLEDNALPVMENPDNAEVAEDEHSRVHSEKDVKKEGERRMEGRKRKRQSDEGDVDEGKMKKKKRKAGEEEAVEQSEEGEEKKEKGSGKQQRFILFVGNLKYAATKEIVQAHFSSCDPPPTVRLMTSKPSATGKPTAKSKGYAFLEFEHKKALQQALKLHHSELQGRMINVELTAGGGGKSDGRLKKLQERNKELHEQRKKHLEKKNAYDAESGIKDLERPQRYSSTSGVSQAPSTKRTWSVSDGKDDKPRQKKRGSKKPPRSLGTGVNAIPVG